jgi:CRISPR-associated protein Cas5t
MLHAMSVLRVVAEGQTTSFRYPHFMQGVQPTFRMPPPATLYGHVCSVLGDWVDPTGVEFAVHFRYQAEFEDLESTHVLTPAGGRLQGTSHPKVLGGNINPFRRGILFRPRLVLYLNRPDWLEAFRRPRYAVALGRSQDLFTYRDVGVVALAHAGAAYFEHTLMPDDFARHTGAGQVVLMPRFVEVRARRHPRFERYLILQRRVYSREFVRYEGEPPIRFLVDPTTADAEGICLGLLFHRWTGRGGHSDLA